MKSLLVAVSLVGLLSAACGEMSPIAPTELSPSQSTSTQRSSEHGSTVGILD